MKMWSLFGLLVLVSCGGGTLANSPQAVSISNLFPLVDGAVWVFRNPATGDLTNFEWHKVDLNFGCEQNAGKLFELHVTKSDPRAYWAPGFNAELRQYYEDSHGFTHSPGTLTVYLDTGLITTSDVVDAGPNPAYPIMPDTYTGPQTIDAPYFPRSIQGALPDNSCLPDVIIPGLLPFTTPQGFIPFTVKLYEGTVVTPFYSGKVIESEQHEGVPKYENFEVSSFAPGLGIVKQTVFKMAGATIDPPMVIERIH